jgi:predicted nucleotidyltransferase
MDRDRCATRLPEFCRKWQIEKLWVFGSAARGDDRPGSDIDLLVTFLPDATTSTWDWPEMIDELSEIFGREIDLLSEGILRNPYRRATILRDRELLYAA